MSLLQRLGRLDGAAAVLLALWPLLLVPSRLKIAALGGVGAPAALAGLGLLLWWLLHHVSRVEPESTHRHPVRIATGVVGVCLLVSFVAASTRPPEPLEPSTALLGMIAFLSWGGLLLVAHDGLRDWAGLVRVLRRLVVLTAVVAGVGVVQFVTHQQLIDRIHLPGLVLTQSLGDLGARSGFSRPTGTSLHAIEFGAVLTMVLPLALTFAVFDRARPVLARWLPVAVIGFAVAVSLSRSAVIGAVVGLVVVMARWPVRSRVLALAALPVVGALLFVTVPGLLGAVAGMFSGLGGDDSARSRIDSYPVAFSFVAERPWFGRGFGTFLPTYRILDNQWLLALIEVGVLGTVALLALLVAAMGCGRAVARSHPDPLVAQLAQATVAGVAVGTVSNAFYDGLSFPMAAAVLFLEVGLCGAFYRLARRDRAALSAGASGGRARAAPGGAAD